MGQQENSIGNGTRLSKYINNRAGSASNPTINFGYEEATLTRRRGDDHPVRVQMSINGVSNMSGSELRMGIKKSDGTVDVVNGGGNGISSGVVEFFLPTGVFDTVGSYPFEVEVTFSVDGKKYTIGGGTLNIVDDLIK